MLKISRLSVLQRSCRAEIGGEAQLRPREICSASAGSLSPRRWSSLLTSVHKRVILLPTRRGTARLRGMGAQNAQQKDAVTSPAALNKMAFLWHGKACSCCSRCWLCEGTWCRARAGRAPRPESGASCSIDTGGRGWGGSIALVLLLGDEQRCDNKSFSNYIFMGTSSFSPLLRLTSWSLMKVKFKVHSPPVEVPPVRNKLLLVHSSLFFQRIKRKK